MQKTETIVAQMSESTAVKPEPYDHEYLLRVSGKGPEMLELMDSIASLCVSQPGQVIAVGLQPRLADGELRSVLGADDGSLDMQTLKHARSCSLSFSNSSIALQISGDVTRDVILRRKKGLTQSL